jgi:peptidoglycan hydrolase CwlO-like protein
MEEKNMKKLVVVLMAVGLFGAMPVLAAEHEGMKMDTATGMRECALQAESIQQKVKRIQGEISKGSTKYSPEELNKLNEKLKETNKLIEDMYKGGN